jgi:ADP-heptose:LPS heptosyltransferase
VGIPLQGEDLEFPLFEEDWLVLETIPEVCSLRIDKYVCIYPGASVSDRRWSPPQFAVVADAIANLGFRIVLTGTAAEANLTQTVVSEAEALIQPQRALRTLRAALPDTAITLLTGKRHWCQLKVSLAVETAAIQTLTRLRGLQRL